MKILLTAGLIAGMMLMAGAAAAAEPINYDFKNGPDGWMIPDWAMEQKDCVGKSVEVSTDEAFGGTHALKIMTAYPGNDWTAAVIENDREVTLKGYKHITDRVYIPKKAKTDLLYGRIIVTAGPWFFIQMRTPVHLERGKRTEIKVPPDDGERGELLLWQCNNSDECLLAHLDRVRKIALCIKYNVSAKNQGPKYNGPVYADDITIE